MSKKSKQSPVPNSNEGEAEDDYAGRYADLDASVYEDLPDENLVIHMCKKLAIGNC